MNKTLYWIIYQARFSGLLIFALVATLLTLWFVLVGAFDESSLPAGFTTRKELIGIVLMLIILPSYLVAGTIFGQRRSRQLALNAEAGGAYSFADNITSIPLQTLLIGLVLGLAYSILNLPNGGLGIIFSGNSFLLTLLIAQIILWSTVGILLAARYHVARHFYLAGKHVNIDLYEANNLKPFGQAGLTDAFIIIVGFAITILQSLDAQFRFYNYITAIVIIVPAITVLMILPMYSLHLRLVKLKTEEFEKLNQLIRKASKNLTTRHISSLELLLQRRERLKGVHTWPLDIAVITRLLLYVIVPPLAWLGAAYVEILLGGVLGL